MTPKLKNIIIFVSIGAFFVLIYIFFIRSSGDNTAATLISSPVGPVGTVGGDVVTTNSSVAQDFLTLLLSVNNIKLDDSIFSENAFASLKDSSIILTPDGNEGRPNPFAPFGTDIIATLDDTSTALPTTTTLPATAPASTTPPTTASPTIRPPTTTPSVANPPAATPPSAAIPASPNPTTP